MKILYLCDEYPPGKHGGIGTSVKLLARQVAKLGHTVVVAGLYAPGYGGADGFEDEGVTVYRFRRGFNWRIFEDESSFISKAGIKLLKVSGLMDRQIKRDLTAYKMELERLISEHQIDLIEMPDYNDYARFCSKPILFPRLPVPVIVKLHGSLTYFAGESNLPASGPVLKMEQNIIANAVALASVSKYTADKSAFYFKYPLKIEVLYNGINAHGSSRIIKKIPGQVIFTGSLAAKKGIYQLAKAWNMVNEKNAGARLLICGKGDQQKVISYLRDEAKSSVIFMGHLPAESLYDHLAASNISVFPSYAEAFALAPMEAMACGTAVINSNRTSGPELIEDKVNGLLIDPGDPGKMADAILFLLDNPDVCESIAQKGNETIRERFTVENVATQNIEFYKRVLSLGSEAI